MDSVFGVDYERLSSAATYEDATTLANYAGLEPRTVGHKGFIEEAMQ